MPGPSFDESDVDRVLAYFVKEQADAGQFARSLIDQGDLVVEAWGPLQMAVYHLVIRHGSWDVMFHSERGRGDWASVGRVAPPRTPWESYRPMGLAILAWARSHDVPFRLDSPLDLNHDLATYGADALDWLDTGNEPALERLYRVWRESQRIIGSSPAGTQNPQLVAEAVARLEESAR